MSRYFTQEGIEVNIVGKQYSIWRENKGGFDQLHPLFNDNLISDSGKMYDESDLLTESQFIEFKLNQLIQKPHQFHKV